MPCQLNTYRNTEESIWDAGVSTWDSADVGVESLWDLVDVWFFLEETF